MECFSENIVKALKDISDKNLISLETLQNRITKCIIDLSANESLHILESFLSTDLSNIQNKEQYLYEMFLDHLNTIKKSSGKVVYLDGSVNDVSDKNKINQLLSRTGYDLTISAGQRRYGGPPPNWTGDPPDCSNPMTCSQVHIGKLAQTVFEDILVPILETCGKIYQLRIMVDQITGNNKGYAFVDFFTHEEAIKCVETVNNKNLLGSHIQVKLTVPNCRLWVAGFSKKRNLENINYEFKRHFPNVTEIKAFESKNSGQKNKGYCFLVFKNHNEANEARKKLLQNKILIFNQPIRECEWADPIESDKSEPIPRKIHVKFLSAKIEKEFLYSFFGQLGEIKSIDIFDQFAFIEFSNEASVNNILSKNITEVNNQKVAISAAKNSKLSKEQLSRRKRHLRDRERMRPEFLFERLPDYRSQNRRSMQHDEYYSRPMDYNYDYPPDMSFRGVSSRDLPPRDIPREFSDYRSRRFSPDRSFPHQPSRDYVGYPRDLPPRDLPIRDLPPRDLPPRDLPPPSIGSSYPEPYTKYPEQFQKTSFDKRYVNESLIVPQREFDRAPANVSNNFPRKDKQFQDFSKGVGATPSRFPHPPLKSAGPPINASSNTYSNFGPVDPGRPMPPPRMDNPIGRHPITPNYQGPPPYRMPQTRQW